MSGLWHFSENNLSVVSVRVLKVFFFFYSFDGKCYLIGMRHMNDMGSHSTFHNIREIKHIMHVKHCFINHKRAMCNVRCAFAECCLLFQQIASHQFNRISRRTCQMAMASAFNISFCLNRTKITAISRKGLLRLLPIKVACLRYGSGPQEISSKNRDIQANLVRSNH